MRDQRALRNKRGGRKKARNASSSEDGSESEVILEVKENGYKVEELIRRIMKRAEKEDIIRREKTELDNERKRKARQEALGMGGMAVDDNIIKLKDMSLDLELRTRPWNSRSYSDRADLLYQTLYRPFTKNV